MGVYPRGGGGQGCSHGGVVGDSYLGGDGEREVVSGKEVGVGTRKRVMV